MADTNGLTTGQEKALAELGAAGILIDAAGAKNPSCMGETPAEPQKRSVTHAAITGAGIGAVLYPALGILFDTFTRRKSFTSGNRLKFLASEASIGAALNGVLNAAIAWGQNRIAGRKYAEQVKTERQASNSEQGRF